jgi:hypothetical protein
MPHVRLLVPARIPIPLAVLAVIVANIALYSDDAHGHSTANYAVIFETSVGAYSGIIGRVDYQNPDLRAGDFTNGTLWAIDDDTCAPNLAWVEVGWSKRASWGGQVRHKSMYQVSPGCAFTIWPFNLGSPQVGPYYEYRLMHRT